MNVHGSSSSLLATAIAQVANNIFFHGSYGFDIIIYGNRTLRTEKIANDVAKMTTIPHRHRRPLIEEKTLYINRPVILFCSSWIEYEKSVYGTWLHTKFQKDSYFLVFVDQGGKEYLDKYNIFVRNFPRFFHDYFIHDDSTSITMSTFQPFHSVVNCSSPIRVQVNEFSMSSKQWQHKQFSIKKFESMNQCKLCANVPYPQYLAMQVYLDSAGNATIFQGYLTKFDEIISSKLNFTSFFSPAKKILNDIPLISYFNYSFHMHCFLQYDVSSFRKLSRTVNGQLQTVTSPFMKVDEIILISRFKPYTMVEKIFLPLQEEVWWWLIGTFLTLGLVSGFVLIFASTFVRNIVFGSRVSAPLMDMM
jgi:hypothetical protein